MSEGYQKFDRKGILSCYSYSITPTMSGNSTTFCNIYSLVTEVVYNSKLKTYPLKLRTSVIKCKHYSTCLNRVCYINTETITPTFLEIYTRC